MRDKCPICSSTNRIENWEMTYVVPEGWELPEKNIICLCNDCGLIYYDNNKDQNDYDNYYANRYGHDAALTKGAAYERLRKIAVGSMELYPNKDACIVDFGGGNERVIERILKENGYDNAITVNPKEKLPENMDLVIASQVFEHIYDLHEVMQRLLANMKDDGKFIISVPDAIAMTKATELPLLDYHQKHLNHFAPHVLNKLFEMYGYFPTETYYGLEKYYFGYIYTATYEKSNMFDIYNKSKNHVEESINKKIETLNKIDYPIQIWGVADIAHHLLSKVKLNIINFIDNDPCYRGQTLLGIPVTTNVLSHIPIVIMAINQQTSILKDIKDRGLTNEVLVI